MKNNQKFLSKKRVGMSPGTTTYTGQFQDPTTFQLWQYDASDLSHRAIKNPRKISQDMRSSGVNWIQVTGLSDTTAFQTVTGEFGIHPLIQEDILDIDQRPKAEDHDTRLFVTLRAFYLKDDEVRSQQVSFFSAENTILSFHENHDPIFRCLVPRMQDAATRIRTNGSWYLLYACLDVLVDHYFSVLEHYEVRIKRLTRQILDQDAYDALEDLHALKSELTHLWKHITPVTDIEPVLSLFFRETPGLRPLYLKDLADHALHADELTKTYIDMVDNLFNLYFSLVGLRTNRVMQTLTVITLVFMPLTLITGMYGMNFAHMPELRHPWGYPVVLLVMLLITAGVLIWFKRKRWF